jgi:fructose-1,6-bisphosphatase/inositol monophosphatase family enzyme
LYARERARHEDSDDGSVQTITAATLGAILDATYAEFQRLCNDRHDVAIKADGSLVTAVDRGIDDFLRRALEPLHPGAGWLSEESADDAARISEAYAWVVDPLDGTKEFVGAIPEFAVSIGLVCDTQPIAGAVINPATGEAAAAGTDGSWLEWRTAPARRAVDKLRDAVASVSRTEMRDGAVAAAASLVGELRPLGSVAYKLLRVACQCEHLTFTVVGKSEWDICGGMALIANRGLYAARFDGRALAFNQAYPRIEGGFVAGSSALAAALCEQLAPAAGGAPR